MHKKGASEAGAGAGASAMVVIPKYFTIRLLSHLHVPINSALALTRMQACVDPRLPNSDLHSCPRKSMMSTSLTSLHAKFDRRRREGSSSAKGDMGAISESRNSPGRHVHSVTNQGSETLLSCRKAWRPDRAAATVLFTRDESASGAGEIAHKRVRLERC